MSVLRALYAAAFGASTAMVPSPLVTDDTSTSDDKRMALVLEGCKREFDDAAFSRFGQLGLRHGPGFEIKEGRDFIGKYAYECRTAAVFPDRHMELVFYQLMNDPLKPPPRPVSKPRPDPRGQARFWLD